MVVTRVISNSHGVAPGLCLSNRFNLSVCEVTVKSYEWFFSIGAKDPKIVRVITTDFARATDLLTEHFGWKNLQKRVVRQIAVENVIDQQRGVIR